MRIRMVGINVLVTACLVAYGCASTDDDTTGQAAGGKSAGAAGTSAAGKGGSGARGGSTGQGGTGVAGENEAGDSGHGEGGRDASGSAGAQPSGAGDAGEGGGESETVVVPATADIWLAGQPTGASLQYAEQEPDVVPANAPVLVPVVPGSTLTFAATGSTSNWDSYPCDVGSPDGTVCNVSLLTSSNGPANGISALSVPFNALIAVFLDDEDPATEGSVPTALDFTTAIDFATLAPGLRQAFFLGDGRTGTGSGSTQKFVVPAGATRLFLASADAIGSNNGNTGQFTVTVSRR